MGHIIGKIGSAVGGLLGIDPGAQADALAKAAETQAQATKDAAQQQADATAAAAAAQTAQTQQQQQATNAAQQASINQAALSAQIQSQTPAPEAAAKIDLTGDTGGTNDTRRRYNSSSKTQGSTSGGVGIKLT